MTERPDVLVLDINMPDGSGIDVAGELARVAPDVHILMLTMFDDDDSIFAAMRAGARGYLLKGDDHEKISVAIAAVHNGEAIFGPPIALRVIEYLTAPRPGVCATASGTAFDRPPAPTS